VQVGYEDDTVVLWWWWWWWWWFVLHAPYSFRECGK